VCCTKHFKGVRPCLSGALRKSQVFPYVSNVSGLIAMNRHPDSELSPRPAFRDLFAENVSALRPAGIGFHVLLDVIGCSLPRRMLYSTTLMSSWEIR
jgi:hypothetical protein